MLFRHNVAHFMCCCRTRRRRTVLLILLFSTLALFASLLALTPQTSSFKYSVLLDTYSKTACDVLISRKPRISSDKQDISGFNNLSNIVLHKITTPSRGHGTTTATTTTGAATTTTTTTTTTTKQFVNKRRFTESNSLSYKEIYRKMEQYSNYIPSSLSKYKTVMNETEINITLQTLDVFARTMDLHNLTYFLYGGTLIGSLRHHGPIPWDDDIDVIVDKSQSKEVWKVLQSLYPNYVTTKVRRQKFWKIFSKDAFTITPGLPWKWPFVDIWLYEDSGKTITDWSCPWCKPKAVYSKKNIFPLKKRPFGTLSLNTPGKSREFLDMFYKWENECDSRFWNHRKEQQFTNSIQNVSCKRLEKYYPFVKRISLNNGTFKEMLMFNGVPLSYFYDS